MTEADGSEVVSTLVYESSVTTDRGVFDVGESVWVTGWPKSKRATYTVHRILWRVGSEEPDIQVVHDHRDNKQIHSVRPDRLSKRRDRR
jgi:hypothetical protein